MTTTPTASEKVEKPATHFDDPHQVVADTTLTEDQKRQALEALEQDARQLATASAEGMSGGEPTQLHEVLVAKDVIELQPTEQAYKTVEHDLECRIGAATGAERVAIQGALEALKAVQPHGGAPA